MGVFLYGVACYAAFLLTFLYAIGFVENVGVPRSIDAGGPAGPLGTALLINVALMGLFGVQHSVMARPWFKRWLTQYVPPAAERSTFVLATCVVFGLLFLFWRPLPELVWQVEYGPLRAALFGLSLAGFGLVLYASFLIDHFDLFGLRQVVVHWRNLKYAHAPFQTPWLYRLVRNPLMLGFLVAFWSMADMTTGRLLFAAVTTAYIFVGVYFEERDLARHLGEDYRRYKARTPAFFPRFGWGSAAAPATGGGQTAGGASATS